MYTIELSRLNGISKAILLLKDEFEHKTEQDFKQHADFSILLQEIKSWNKYLKL